MKPVQAAVAAVFLLAAVMAAGAAAPGPFGGPSASSGAVAIGCKGCGCRGGPGYRGPNGKCVGWDQLTRVCGNPPTTRCTKEN